jgi:hypothetical protein
MSLASRIGRASIGSQSDRGTIAGPKHADHTGLADIAMNLAAELGKLADDELGRALRFKTEFGVGMQVVAPRRHLVVKCLDAIWNLHSDCFRLEEL